MRKKAMWTRFITLALAFALSLSLAPAALAASGMSNFSKSRTYPGFSDVPENAWYINDLKEAYELGLINGSDGKFNPGGDLTLAEAITMAANLCSIYYGDDFTPGGSPWYQNAVDYAIEVGFILEDEFEDYQAKATRADMAGIFAYTLPAKELTRINRIAWIPDVEWNNYYIDAIYCLYDAGVLTGGENGDFHPHDNITRAEAVCILNRMAVPGNRKSFSLDTAAPGTVVEAANGSYQISVPDGWTATVGSVGSDGEEIDSYASNTGAGLVITTFPRTMSVDAESCAETFQEIYLDPESYNASIRSDRHRVILRGFSAYETGYSYEQDGLDVTCWVYTFENSRFVYAANLIWGDKTTDAEIQAIWEMIYSMVAVLD